MKTLHIHIGTPKTGTTAIQRFCYNNSKVLEKNGYCYPIFPYHYPKVSKMRAHFLLGVIKFENGERNEAQEQKNFREGMQMVLDSFQKYDDVILSDERIWRGMDQEKKDFWEVMQREAEKGGFRLHVIVYLRRQDKYFASLWNQVVKHLRSEETFEQYTDRVGKKQLNYYERLERIASIIGKENITVRRFDGGKFEGGSIYSDFLMTVGLSLTNEYHVPEKEQNTGLYGNTHELKRAVNALPQTKEADLQNFIMEVLQDCSEISRKQYPCEMYSKEEAEAFLEKYKAGNQKVAEEYLHETGTELFDYTVKDMPKWQKDNPYMIDDLSRFVGMMGIYLYRENQKLKYEVRHPFKTWFRRCKRKIKRIFYKKK